MLITLSSHWNIFTNGIDKELSMFKEERTNYSNICKSKRGVLVGTSVNSIPIWMSPSSPSTQQATHLFSQKPNLVLKLVNHILVPDWLADFISSLWWSMCLLAFVLTVLEPDFLFLNNNNKFILTSGNVQFFNNILVHLQSLTNDRFFNEIFDQMLFICYYRNNCIKLINSWGCLMEGWNIE